MNTNKHIKSTKRLLYKKVYGKAYQLGIKDFITKMYGKRCKDKELGCAICDEWELFDEYQKTEGSC